MSWHAWAETNSAVLLATGGAEAYKVVADKIHKALEEPLLIGGQSMDMTASIGIARYGDHGEEADALLRAADVAMYEAKRTKAALRGIRLQPR